MTYSGIWLTTWPREWSDDVLHAVGSWLLETFNVHRLLHAPPGLIHTEILRPAQTMSWMCLVWLTEQTAIISLSGINWSVFGRVRKIAKSTNSFLLSICLSVRMEQLCSHRTEFNEIWYLNIFRKYVEKIKIPLKSDKNNGHFTWRTTYTYDNISLNSS